MLYKFEQGGFAFGIDPEKVAQMFEGLAQDCRSGKAIPKETIVMFCHTSDDWNMRELRFRFARREPVEETADAKGPTDGD